MNLLTIAVLVMLSPGLPVPGATQDGLPAAAEKASRISAEDFGALPFLSEPRLSPSGTRLVASVYSDGARKLAIVDLGLPAQRRRLINIPDQGVIESYRWAGNDRILARLGQRVQQDGRDALVTSVVLFDLQSGNSRFIVKAEEIRDSIIYVDPDGHWLLVTFRPFNGDFPSVWRVDLDRPGSKEIVHERSHVWRWFCDASGTVRAGIGMQDEYESWFLVYRRSARQEFSTIFKRKVSASQTQGDIEGFVFAGDGDQGYAIANTRNDRYGLYHYDFATDSLGEAIFEHPAVDLTNVEVEDNGELAAVRYTDDRRRVLWLDPALKRSQEEIDRQLPGHLNELVSMSRDRTKIIVWSASASDPGRYYYYQRGPDTLSMLAEPYERLKGKQLVSVESTNYVARDGLSIPAYLTVPQGREARMLPLIVLPHGGPYARDVWAYDVWVQFLANRGYVVLQPNFRGSTGYGRSFVAKGLGQFGRGMQDDLDDGVKWLVDRGLVDPRRVCIMGASYGGYAALWAAARNPDIYRCAISFAGPSDLAEMLRYDRSFAAARRYDREWRQRVQGDRNFDLATVSPLRAIDRISIPLLIAHGDKDQIVPPSQSSKLHDALIAANKPHEYVVYEGEGHGLAKADHLTDFLTRVDAFLAAHNPAD
jgi:dipeptidyl aminopeptidase/acylaminoacyl peptidase